MQLPNCLDPRGSWPAFLVVAGLALVLLFTLLRPGISAGLSGLHLPLFWSVHVGIPLVLLQAAQMVLSRWRGLVQLNPWVQTALTGVVGSALFAPLALILDKAFVPAAASDDRHSSLSGALLDEFLSLAPIVTLVWLGLNATRLWQPDRPAPPGAMATPASSALPPADLPLFGRGSIPEFWQRVPRVIGRDLVALSAELHYLRVRTTRGEALILHPFGKAVAELGPTGSGLQIHRSHWVALAHVVKVDRLGQRAECGLSTGHVLPVSRQHRAALLAALGTGQGPAASPGA